MSRAPFLLAALLLAACGDAGPVEPLVPKPEPAAARHQHQPQRGGRLVEIGAHVAQVEIVHDREAGTLAAYIMDGHASRAVLTGETVGDTSRFEIRAGLLERIRGFTGVLVELSVFDRVFRDVSFTYAPE
ncbi:MAG: hypothetical protein ACYTF8_18125 [Planctomycetota bacterium]